MASDLRTSTVSLICFADGKLINGDKNAEYLEGYRKAGDVSKSIGFIGFKEKIQRMMKLSYGITFRIKCGLYYDENTLIATDVDDDESLNYILDRSEAVRPLRTYIIKDESSPTTTSIQRSPMQNSSTDSLPHMEEPWSTWDFDDHLGLNKFPDNGSEDNRGRNKNSISCKENVSLPHMEEILFRHTSEKGLPLLPTRVNSYDSISSDSKMQLHDVLDFVLGQEFSDVYAFRDALSDFSVRTKREHKPVKTTKSKMAVKCNAAGCDWRIQANQVSDSPTFKVTKYHSLHTCRQCKNDLDHRQATSKWIVSKMKSTITDNPNITASEIVNAIRKRFGIQISYNKAVKAKLKAREAAFEESFRFLPPLIEELKRNGCVAEVGHSNDHRFLYFFWAFHACVHAFHTHLRPMLQIDIMPLKFGVLMTANGFDGDSDKVPVAFGIFEAENEVCLEVFLNYLKQFIIPEFLLGHTFSIFTKSYGTKLVHKVFPGVIHEDFFPPDVCSTEMKDAKIQEWMTEAAQIATSQDCHSLLDKIQKERKDFYSWFQSRGNTHEERELYFWLHYRNGLPTRSHKDIRVDASSLYASLYENDVRSLKDLPITELIMCTSVKVARYFRDRKSRGTQMMTKLTPCSEFLVEVTREYPGDNVKVEYNSLFEEYEVVCGQQVVEVNLESRSCGCYEFQLRGRPCVHAAALILHQGLDMTNYFQHWFTAETYRRTYAYDLHPLADCSQWKSQHPGICILPPKWKMHTRGVGRPPKSKLDLY